MALAYGTRHGGAGPGAHRRPARRQVPPVRRLLVLVALCLCASLCATACAPSAPPTADDSAGPQVRQVLDRRADAMLHRDRAAYLASFDPRAKHLRAAQSTEFADLAAVPLRSWAYDVSDVATTGDTATVHAVLRYRLTGYDSAPVSDNRFLELVRRSGHWYVSLDQPADGNAAELWQQGRVDVVRGADSLVLGVGQDPALLRQVAEVADRAVPAVDAAWPGSWERRVVVYVPASLHAMAALLDRSPGAYHDIAAVTTGETGGAGAAPADRVIVNPEAYATLSAFGTQVVLTHEITHVATRSATSAAAPTWLSEGFADWSAYRGSGRTAAALAPELRDALRAGRFPVALPADKDFAFGSDPQALSRAYEEGWLACKAIADRWGEQRLTDFYRAVGAHDGQAGAVADALHDVLATTPADFTRLWQKYLSQQLG